MSTYRLVLGVETRGAATAVCPAQQDVRPLGVCDDVEEAGAVGCS
jgi:hypothetical protein